MTQHYILYHHSPASKEGYSKIDSKWNSTNPETRLLLGDDSDDFTPSFFTKVKAQVALLLVKLKLRSSVPDVGLYSPLLSIIYELYVHVIVNTCYIIN